MPPQIESPRSACPDVAGASNSAAEFWPARMQYGNRKLGMTRFAFNRKSAQRFSSSNQRERLATMKRRTRCEWCVFCLLFLAISESANGSEPVVNANVTIRSKAGNSEIVITTTERLAGAIHSLTWNNREFIDSADHGRQLQSASNLDSGNRITDETFNPTEAGSRLDGAGLKSTSRLLHIVTGPQELQTTNQMAFWLAPGEKSGANLAKNSTKLSNHLLTKRVKIGYGSLPNVIQYDVTFGVPIGETHHHAVFEALTGYMPAEFEIFWKYNTSTGNLEPLDDGPGEQQFPVVLATSTGSHAMGIYTPEQNSDGTEIGSYGRFRFPDAKVVKWNSVFRRTDPQGLPAGEYSFRNFVIVGDLATVKESIRILRLVSIK